MRQTQAETHRGFHRNLILLTFTLGSMVLFLCQASANEEIGMVTLLSGEALYWGAEDHGKSSSVQSFMKVKDGDFFKLHDGATLQFIIFKEGLKETWQGPVSFQLTSAGGKIDKSGDTARQRPIVSKVPDALSKEVKRVSAMIDMSRLYRAGAFQVRGNKKIDKTQPPEPVALSSEEQMALENARTTYKTIANYLDPHDLTNELYLFSVLADFDQYQEMSALIALMRKKQPENNSIDELELWLKEQY